MKKVFIASAFALILSSGLMSCKRCQVCTKSSSPEVRVCEKDYSNNTLYGLALDAYEAQGYSCKNSI
ncbi:MAG: hypothetical protein IPP77_09675 [Bacteroidetes bacterium]|nr:hypothetical protein [Bacteroidota bacterium]